MSSPISMLLRQLRMQAGFTQQELTRVMGYEQAYLSAIELGLKPPSKEFVGKLVACLQLSQSDQEAIQTALEQSRRRYLLPADASTATYMFCHDLWGKIETAHPAVIEAMHAVLKLEDDIQMRPRKIVTRLRRKQKAEAPM